jgi:hypothetical protein
MASKLLTLSADETTATVADATVTDIFTTVLDQNKAVTGLYGLGQRAGLVLTGMMVQNIRVGNGWNPFR